MRCSYEERASIIKYTVHDTGGYVLNYKITVRFKFIKQMKCQNNDMNVGNGVDYVLHMLARIVNTNQSLLASMAVHRPQYTGPGYGAAIHPMMYRFKALHRAAKIPKRRYLFCTSLRRHKKKHIKSVGHRTRYPYHRLMRADFNTPLLSWSD